MTKGTAVFSYGLGGPIWSGGLRAIAKEVQLVGWRAPVYRWTQAATAVKAVEKETDLTDPIAVIFHSAGASFANNFARLYRKPIDLGISVDAWFPMEMAPNFKRVISIRASRQGRFDVFGANVQGNVVIDGTHTTIDDSQALRNLVNNELARLS
jgi:pimeloyl-ACP methyl ester carboxylesterase